MKKWLNKWTRKLHRWGALLTVLPMVLVIGSGLLLQVKKQLPWVQPPTQKGEARVPILSFQQILDVARAQPEANIGGWDDIERLDIRPSKGIVKVKSNSSWELQIDTRSGAVLSTKYRRSDWIESLHDGSWFGDGAKLWVFLPNGLVLLGLWATGIYLWCLPVFQKRANRRRRTRNATSP